VIVAPAGWAVTPTVEGAILDGPWGRVLHVERARPFVRLGELVRARMRTRIGFVLGVAEQLITDEGEYGAVIAAETESRRVVWGAVFGDDSLAWYELEGARDAELVEPMRMLTRAHRLGLGLRWRRFRYAVPVGWDALARDSIADWLAPGFPNRWGVITVYPAFPASASTAGIVPMLLAQAATRGFTPQGPSVITELGSDHGLSGVWTEVEGTFDGAPVQRALAAFLDQRYVYALELQTRTPGGWTEHRDVFSSLCRSVEPVPHPRIPMIWEV